jgi:D-tyrosyl-tRNA(Tyr) deacylase
MIGLLQRVSTAHVDVDGVTVGSIDRGLLVLIGIQRDDNEAKADRLLQKTLGYRVFADESGRMNKSLRDISGGLLLVPQFTLAADTKKGTRPGFSTAAPPDEGERLFNYLLAQTKAEFPKVESGVFGADMQVQLLNDGPVTFWLET